MASTNGNQKQDRISSVSETQKITNAMYLIASTKLRKARARAGRTRAPTSRRCAARSSASFRTVEDVDTPLLLSPRTTTRRTALSGTYGCLVITADKGLGGRLQS